MNDKFNKGCGLLTVAGFGLMLLTGLAWAQASELSELWQRVHLLDDETVSALRGQERRFSSLFPLPSEYEEASEQERKRLVNEWIEDLRSRDRKKVTNAAAYLGIFKAKVAAKPLEEAIVSGRYGGRLRWVCTRSLGQIGDTNSIPALIGLLDSKNKDTRVYARASLAEITGVYLGDDKENWKKWQPGEMTPLPTLKEKIGKGGEKRSGDQRSFSRDRLGFRLPDIYGRIVDSQDYTNVPVLIMSGSCWCGGCQQDAEPLRRIAAEYAPRGLQTIRTVAGDNELAALDFQRHYRLGFVQLLDTNRSVEKRYNDDGWTFLMLTDHQGKIVYKINSPHEKDWRELRRILNQMLRGPTTKKTVIRDGISYMPATLRRTGEIESSRVCERFPSLACGPDGKVYVVFAANRGGSSDILLRVFDGQKWSEDIPVAATAADEYDGTVIVDNQGRVWIAWTSNANGKNYNIYVVSFIDPARPGAVVQVTDSDDDAMHARMACDEKGHVWVTYYEWHKMGKYSRDKEVYLRKFKNGQWSNKVQVSPTDVPQHEDHSDPAISPYGSGVVVTWSWDFHPPNKGYSNDVAAPTIFMRTVNNRMGLGKVCAVSHKNIDVTPSVLTCDNRQIWCSWDSLGRDQRKRLCISSPRVGRDNPISNIRALNEPAANVCTPSFAVSAAGSMTVLWSETADSRRWALKRADLHSDGKDWSKGRIAESEGNPRYCSADYDSEGQLWVSYSAQTDVGREIVVRKLAEQEVARQVRRADGNTTFGTGSASAQAIRRLRRAIDERYSYRDLRGVDWDAQFDRYEASLNRAKSPDEFAERAARMLAPARDMHLWVKVDGKTVGGFKRKIKRNYNLDVLRRTVPGWRDRSKFVSAGRFPEGIGYIMISSWRKDRTRVLDAALKALGDLLNTRALIIDVRPNGGGSEPFAQEFAGCFIEKPVLYAKHVYRNANSPEGWGRIRERILEPNKNQPRYSGKIAVLMGQANLSSCEAFLLMMRQIPNCKLIGQKSYGSSGNPKPVDLGNGVTVWLPSWKALRPDDSCFEGEGIKPDIVVRTSEAQLRTRDRVLKAALKHLRSDF